MRLVLYQPDIPQNTGTMLRLAACLGIAVDLIEPAGFVLSDRRLRRAGLDYLDGVTLARHASWTAYCAAAPIGRLVLLTTRGDARYTDFAFAASDRVMVGRESGGVPDPVHGSADARLRIPMTADARSINVACAAAMVLGEAMRQLEWRATGPTP
ncbi:MAG TPA: tRNA (cytidine(34)-2'-O)-methyltransferase [Candidatus Sulfotelmatobacter sp.]|nr:tRNA (cytidine(34)-2'-O)-methyltransferase [Candidatus Sulfotelmatobacter sp.]